ncbi:SpoIIE family protein phosphatase [Flammeovirga pacifica]|uniref:SpoIIE family protein phosphatase n=1 Tax=Flammeovirga pacifica TaxID=915059 RepID=UPI0018FE3BC2|nr:SpoIIE family protein phosphatase [Flammeovirga pacifica]
MILLHTFYHLSSAQTSLSDEMIQTVLNLEKRPLKSQVDSLGENIPKISISKSYADRIVLLESKSQEFEKRKRYEEATRGINEIATIYWEHFYFSEARAYFHQSIRLNNKIGNHNGIGKLNNNIGMICFDYSDYELALEYFNITLDQRKKDVKQKDPLLSSLTNVALTLNKLKRYNEAIVELKSAERVAHEMNEPERIRTIYGMLSETYDKAGDSKNAQKYFELYRTFHELILKQKEVKIEQSIRESELEKKLLQLEKENKELQLVKTQQELLKTENQLAESDSTNLHLTKVATKKELQILTLQQEKEIQRLELKEQDYLHESEQKETRTKLNALFVFIIFLIVIAILIYRSYFIKQRANKKLAIQQKKILHQKNLLETQNENITQSIAYAAYIQKAVLEEVSELNNYVNDSFILFEPRDLVSGDFYWFKEIKTTSDNGQSSNKTIITAADCTGHGVPGAIMSMIGVKLMDQVVLEEHITQPNQVLEKLHTGIVESLHQEATNIHDGMDLAFISIDHQNNTFEFAGAKNPLIYIADNELYQIKGDKKSIGDQLHNQYIEYTNHKIEISTPTWLYIFSDGFNDQFGGEKGGKFMIKRLKKILLENHQKSGKEQYEILKKTLSEWMGEEDQVDDILVMGIKILPA